MTGPAPRPDSVPDVDIVSHDVYAAGVPHAGYDRLRARGAGRVDQRDRRQRPHRRGLLGGDALGRAGRGPQGLAHVLVRGRRHGDRRAGGRRDRGPQDDARDRSAAPHPTAPARQPGVLEGDGRDVCRLGHPARRDGARRRPRSARAGRRGAHRASAADPHAHRHPRGPRRRRRAAVRLGRPDRLPRRPRLLGRRGRRRRHRPLPTAAVPQPGQRAGLRLRRTPHHRPRPAPGGRRDLGARRRGDRRRTADGTRARHVLPAAPDRRERDDEALALARADRLRRTPGRARAAARRPDVARPGRRGGAPLGEPAGALPPHRDHRHAARRRPDRRRRQGRHVVRGGQLRPGAVRRPAPLRRRTRRPTAMSRSAAAARTSASVSGWPAWRSACSSRRWSGASTGSSWPDRSSASAATSSTV